MEEILGSDAPNSQLVLLRAVGDEYVALRVEFDRVDLTCVALKRLPSERCSDIVNGDDACWCANSEALGLVVERNHRKVLDHS